MLNRREEGRGDGYSPGVTMVSSGTRKFTIMRSIAVRCLI